MRFIFTKEANAERKYPSLDAKRNGEYYIQPSEYFWKTGRRNVVCPKVETLRTVLRKSNAEVSEERFRAQWEVFVPYLRDPGLMLMMRDFGMESRYFVPFCLTGMLKGGSEDERQKLPWLTSVGEGRARLTALGVACNMDGEMESIDANDPFLRWVLRAPTAKWIRENGERAANLLARRDKIFYVNYGREGLLRCARHIGIEQDVLTNREVLAEMLRLVIVNGMLEGEAFVFDVNFDHWCNRLALIAFGRGGERPWMFSGPQDLTEFLEGTLRNLAVTFEVLVDTDVPPVGAMVIIDKLKLIA